METPELDQRKAPQQAQDLLEVLQIWGMSRGHAVKLLEHCLRLLGDSSYRWRDLRNANEIETRNMLLSMAEKGKGKLPS